MPTVWVVLPLLLLVVAGCSACYLALKWAWVRVFEPWFARKNGMTIEELYELQERLR